MHNLIVLWALKYDVYIIDVYLSVPNSELSEYFFLFILSGWLEKRQYHKFECVSITRNMKCMTQVRHIPPWINMGMIPPIHTSQCGIFNVLPGGERVYIDYRIIKLDHSQYMQSLNIKCSALCTCRITCVN